MSKTATKIGEPARHRDWGLTVDKLSNPTEYVVIRYPTEGRRHAEPFTEVQRFAYTANGDRAVAELVERTEMPKPTASSLVMAVSVKLVSPKAADADSGHRPVV
jgi:hypothetical protein